MQRTLIATATAAGLTLSAGTASAADWFPIADEGFSAQPSVAVMGGNQSFDWDEADSGTVAGVELAMNCGLFAPEEGRIRQQISLTQYDEDGLETTHLELNPHYLFVDDGNLTVGAGPGLGWVQGDLENGGDADAFALQAGASVNYDFGPAFVGAEARYQWTTEADFGNDVEEDLSNTRVMAKVGVNF
ncbi:MAG: outer membrane protein [Pseudomonadota bacterium]